MCTKFSLFLSVIMVDAIFPQCNTDWKTGNGGNFSSLPAAPQTTYKCKSNFI